MEHYLHWQLRKAKQQFSYLPQQASFPTKVTLREVLEFHARPRSLDLYER